MFGQTECACAESVSAKAFDERRCDENKKLCVFGRCSRVSAFTSDLCGSCCSFIVRSAWIAPPPAAPQTVLGRGGHQMLAIRHANGDPYLYVFGGRGGDNTVNNQPEVRTDVVMWSFYMLYACQERAV